LKNSIGQFFMIAAYTHGKDIEYGFGAPVGKAGQGRGRDIF
jgi:hypothetical protein